MRTRQSRWHDSSIFDSCSLSWFHFENPSFHYNLCLLLTFTQSIASPRDTCQPGSAQCIWNREYMTDDLVNSLYWSFMSERTKPTHHDVFTPYIILNCTIKRILVIAFLVILWSCPPRVINIKLPNIGPLINEGIMGLCDLNSTSVGLVCQRSVERYKSTLGYVFNWQPTFL